MPMTPPRKCIEPGCHRSTHYRYCRQHRAARTASHSARHRLCLTLSEIASLCDHLSTRGVSARAELTATGIALLFDNGIEPLQREDIGFEQLLAISNADETTELLQSILRTFAREAQKKDIVQGRFAAA